MKTKEIIENMRICYKGKCDKCTMVMKSGCIDELLFAAAKKLGKCGEAPAVDAVEVVRCGDCKYWGDEEGISEKDGFRFARCNVHNHFRYGEHFGWCPKEDDFCSYGERREEE